MKIGVQFTHTCAKNCSEKEEAMAMRECGVQTLSRVLEDALGIYQKRGRISKEWKQ